MAVGGDVESGSEDNRVRLITPPTLGQWYRPATRHVRRVKRRGIVMFIVAVILLQIILGVLSAKIQYALGWSSGFSPINSAARLALSILLALVPVLIHARLVRSRLERLRWQVCPNCLYNVDGLEESNLCPECGRAFNTEFHRQDFAAYERFLALLLPWNWFGRS